MTLNSPKPARSSAVAAKLPTSVAVNRGAAIDLAMYSVMVWIRPIAWSGSALTIAVRSEPATLVSAPAARTTAVRKGHGACSNAVYSAGFGCSASRTFLTSPTMPTISRGPVWLYPRVTCLPMGSSPGQYRCASDSLMMATFGASARSPLVNTRPRTRRIPMARK